MQRIINVVASTWMEAREHEHVPKIGQIDRGGWQLISKRPRQVPRYPKWWLVDLEYERIKVGWRKIGLTAAMRSESNERGTE